MRKFFLQANDQQDLVDWVNALNKATKITVRIKHKEGNRSIKPFLDLVLIILCKRFQLISMIFRETFSSFFREMSRLLSNKIGVSHSMTNRMLY